MQRVFKTSQALSRKLSSRIAPWLVSIAAVLWATDALFRSELTPLFPPVFIVTLTHLLCLPACLALFFSHRSQLKKFSSQQWLALIVVSFGGSVLAMVFFTTAFASTKNFNVPILLQKLQPIVAILCARWALKEKPTRLFYLMAAIAIFGGYLVSFSNSAALFETDGAHLSTVIYSLLAAIIWGACTVAGRYLLNFQIQAIVTSSRYLLATVFLILICLWQNHHQFFNELQFEHWINFSLMAYIPGLLALFIYYTGLKNTPASLATIGELSFPLAAVFINWTFLNSPLNTSQIIGAALLISSTTVIHWRWSQNHHHIVHQTKI